MDVNRQIRNLQAIVPSLKVLTKPINAVGNYLFFSHVEFDQVQPRYLFSIYLARKALRTDLGDILEVLTPLMEEHSDLFTIKRMIPIQLEGLFVTYQIDISISEYYTKEEPWLT
jgi:hypothetical protein